ncbi:MAG: aminoacyl-tRNA hydrolase, partial [Acidimicrobiales bacterium]
TRHNVGADTVERLATRHGQRLRGGRHNSLVAEAVVGGRRLARAVPITNMNDSGLAVGPLVRRFGVEDLTRLVVVHDELDLPVGKLQVKAGGGLAGPNGLRSIKAHLHSDAFSRVRIGIGKPPGGKERGADHVLRPPAKRERTELDVTIELAADAVECILAEGVVAAQNRFNG